MDAVWVGRGVWGIHCSVMVNCLRPLDSYKLEREVDLVIPADLYSVCQCIVKVVSMLDLLVRISIHSCLQAAGSSSVLFPLTLSTVKCSAVVCV